MILLKIKGKRRKGKIDLSQDGLGAPLFCNAFTNKQDICSNTINYKTF